MQKALESRIAELKEYEHLAIQCKDLHEALLLHGGIIHLERFMLENRDEIEKDVR